MDTPSFFFFFFPPLCARPPLQNQRATTRGNSRDCDLSGCSRWAAEALPAPPPPPPPPAANAKAVQNVCVHNVFSNLSGSSDLQSVAKTQFIRKFFMNYTRICLNCRCTTWGIFSTAIKWSDIAFDSTVEFLLVHIDEGAIYMATLRVALWRGREQRTA